MNESSDQAPIAPIGSIPPPSKNYKHIDDFLDATMDLHRWPELAYPHFLFTYWRQPASVKHAHAPFMAQFELYVDYDGRTWRVTGASRMGDIWLAKKFSREHGYDLRVDPKFELFSNWRRKADWELSYDERLKLARAAGFTFERLKGSTPAMKQKAFEDWTRSNGIPNRYIDLSPEQRDILRSAEEKKKGTS